LDNASPPRITAAAGTKLAGASSQANVIIFTCERILQPIFSIFKAKKSFLLSSFTQYHWIKLSPIVQDSSLLAYKPGPYLSPSVVDRPLRPTKDLRLGALLSHQRP